MKEALLDSEQGVSFYAPTNVFFCPEESQFYSQCLEKMLFKDGIDCSRVIEFGSGDGRPVISSLLKTQFNGLIQGYELNVAACKLAHYRIKQYNLSHRYVIHNTCFFENLPPTANYLIANPPYLPALDDDICMPSLHGGLDGAAITNRLLSIGCENALLMISAYSNPVETIEYAIAQGYQVEDFMISPLKFGYYSSEPKVRNRIAELQRDRKAFYSANIYFLAGVLFRQQHCSKTDLSTELIKVMTTL